MHEFLFVAGIFGLLFTAFLVWVFTVYLNP